MRYGKIKPENYQQERCGQSRMAANSEVGVISGLATTRSEKVFKRAKGTAQRFGCLTSIRASMFRHIPILKSKMPSIICGLAVCFSVGCSSRSSLPTPMASPMASLHVTFIPVDNPVDQLCYDDTLSRTEWFNAPVAKFSGAAIDLFGRPVTTKDLQDWATKYYEHKVERALWVQIAPDSVGNAEQALLPLVRMFPDLQVRC